MLTSENLNELATALAKAQGTIENAGKDSLNPHFKKKYADLASVREAIRKPLSENGLAYIQTVRTQGTSVEIETRLIHSSGQFVGDTLSIPLAQTTAQAVGSATSYGRRYSLMAIVGIAAEDDDGHVATETAPPPKPRLQNGNGTATRPGPKPAAREAGSPSDLIFVIREAKTEAELQAITNLPHNIKVFEAGNPEEQDAVANAIAGQRSGFEYAAKSRGM